MAALWAELTTRINHEDFHSLPHGRFYIESKSIVCSYLDLIEFINPFTKWSLFWIRVNAIVYTYHEIIRLQTKSTNLIKFINV